MAEAHTSKGHEEFISPTRTDHLLRKDHPPESALVPDVPEPLSPVSPVYQGSLGENEDPFTIVTTNKDITADLEHHERLFEQLSARQAAAREAFKQNQERLAHAPYHKEIYDIGSHDWGNLKSDIQAKKLIAQLTPEAVFTPPPEKFYPVANACLRAMEYGAQGIELPRRTYSLENVCHNAVEAARYYSGGQQNFDLNNNAGEPIILHGQEELMTIATFTMLQNSTKFGATNVKLDLYADPNYIDLRIADNGKGVLPEILDRIKEAGVSDSGSTGLGLYMVNNYMRTLGGQVNVDNIYHPQTNDRCGFYVQTIFPYKR